MKPSTRHNLKDLIKDEVVSRFEDVVKEEIRKHNLALEKTDKQLALLLDMFEKYQHSNENLHHKNNQKYDEMMSLFHSEKKTMEKDFSRHNEHLRNLEALCKEEKEKYNFVTKQESNEKFECFSEEFNAYKDRVDEMKEKIECSFYTALNNFKIEVLSELYKLQDVIKDFEKKLHVYEEKLETNIVDAKGITRMMKIDQKSIFIIEKKIENIYTVIERMKKDRG